MHGLFVFAIGMVTVGYLPAIVTAPQTWLSFRHDFARTGIAGELLLIEHDCHATT